MSSDTAARAQRQMLQAYLSSAAQLASLTLQREQRHWALRPTGNNILRQKTPWCATKRTLTLSLVRQLWMKFTKRQDSLSLSGRVPRSGWDKVVVLLPVVTNSDQCIFRMRLRHQVSSALWTLLVIGDGGLVAPDNPGSEPWRLTCGQWISD